MRKRIFSFLIFILFSFYSCGKEHIEVDQVDPQLIGWWAISLDCTSAAHSGASFEQDYKIYMLDYLQGDINFKSSWHKTEVFNLIQYANNGKYKLVGNKEYHYTIQGDCLIFTDQKGYNFYNKRIQNENQVVPN